MRCNPADWERLIGLAALGHISEAFSDNWLSVYATFTEADLVLFDAILEKLTS